MKNTNTTGNKVRNLLRAARAGFKSAAHFNLAFGKFQKLMNHLSIPLRDSANNEFRRVALANWKGARAW